MPRPPLRLSPAEIEQYLASLPGWTREGDKIKRRYEFPDFVTAFGFMSQVAIEAERRDHHPDWSNVYRIVEVALSTHDVQGLTMKDIELAQAMERRAAPLLSSGTTPGSSDSGPSGDEDPPERDDPSEDEGVPVMDQPPMTEPPEPDDASEDGPVIPHAPMPPPAYEEPPSE